MFYFDQPNLIILGRGIQKKPSEDIAAAIRTKFINFCTKENRARLYHQMQRPFIHSFPNGIICFASCFPNKSRNLFAHVLKSHNIKKIPIASVIKPCSNWHSQFVLQSRSMFELRPLQLGSARQRTQQRAVQVRHEHQTNMSSS